MVFIKIELVMNKIKMKGIIIRKYSHFSINKKIIYKVINLSNNK